MDPLLWSSGLSILSMAESTLARIRSKWCSLAQDNPTAHLEPAEFELNSVVLAFLHVHILWYRYKMSYVKDHASLQELVIKLELAYEYARVMAASGSLRYWLDSRALLLSQGAVILQEVSGVCDRGGSTELTRESTSDIPCLRRI